MAAKVQVHEMTGSGVGTDKTEGVIRFKSADETSVDTNNRLTIPSSGTNYSYTKQLQLYIAVAPDTDFQDFEAYSDGDNSFGTGVGVQYDTAASFSSNVNTDIAGTDLFTATDETPIDMDANNAGPFATTGYIGDLLRLQMTVADTAEPGTRAGETLTFSYMET